MMSKNSYLNTLILILLLLPTGCAPNAAGARYGFFSATAPVIAMLRDDMFVGEAVGYMDRTGTINMKSVVDDSLSCIGQFHYTGAKIGIGTVQCNDGGSGDFQFHGLSNLSGYGLGKSSRGPLSFTFGLTPEEAQQYLALPKGKKITKDKATIKLEDV